MQVDRYVAERRRRQNRRRKYFWVVGIVLAAYFIALCIFVFIVRSPAFQVKRITIEGTETIPSSTVMDLLQSVLVRNDDSLSKANNGWKAMLGFNNMLIWPNALSSSDIAAIPPLAGLTISKNYFLHTITVTVTERQPLAVWCRMPGDATASEQCFWFDDRGVAFAKTFDTEGGTISVVHDYTQNQNRVVLGGNVLPIEFMPNLISIIEALKSSGLGVQDIALNDLSLQQIDVTTVNGPVIHFSLRFPADDDLVVLQNLIAKPGFAKLQYIDFTVENRAYYK